MSAALTWLDTFDVNRFALRLMPNTRRFTSPYSGSTQVIDLLGERWAAQLSMPARARRSGAGAAREAFFGQLRGMDGTVALWHLARPVPVGSMRGAPTLASIAAQGAQTLVINTSPSTPGATVKAGDMLGCGGQLFMVAADATANGSGQITAATVNRVRAALASATAVVWDRPKTTFRLASDDAAGPIAYEPGITTSIEVDLIESY